MKREILAEGVEIYLGDCREILPTLGRVDAVVTDPPYGVDKAEWDARAVMEWLPAARAICSSVFVTPGIKNLAEWPRYDWIGSYSYPIGFKAAMGGGLNAWEPILIYGRNTLPLDHKQFPPVASEKIEGHPTPKPLAPFRWLINTATGLGETILDPFMGSGTTGVAAVKLGRKFIGVEIEPKYFEIARRRISEALKQPDMFIETPKPVQEALDI